MRAWLLHSPRHSPAPPSRSCPFDPAALPGSGAGKEKNQQSCFTGSHTASGGTRTLAMLPRAVPAARADSCGVTGVAAAVPEHFLLPRPAGRASRASSACVRATRPGHPALALRGEKQQLVSSLTVALPSAVWAAAQPRLGQVGPVLPPRFQQDETRWCQARCQEWVGVWGAHEWGLLAGKKVLGTGASLLGCASSCGSCWLRREPGTGRDTYPTMAQSHS